VITKLNNPKCGEKAIDFFDDLITRGSFDVLSLLCGEFSEDSDKCTKLLASHATFDQVISKWKAPLMPVLDLIKSFPE